MSRDEHNDFDHDQVVPQKPRRKVLFTVGIVFLIGIALAAALFVRTGMTFTVITGGKFWEGNAQPTEHVHAYDPDRLNILVLGIRGEASQHGGLLSDTIMLVSIHKPTSRVAFFSIPRDLFVELPNHAKREKINFAYALGFERGGWEEGLQLSKTVVETITDVTIDSAIVVDFTAFQEIIDVLGGVDVYVSRDFIETKQFTNFPLELKKGVHHMDGTTALYYVRSRFSTSDFDRARRQQDLLIAIRDKALTLGVAANPQKVLSLLRSVERNVRSDMQYASLDDLLRLARSSKNQTVIRKVFDTSPEGLLESQSIDGMYVLLPRSGNYTQLSEAVQRVFEPQSSSPSPSTPHSNGTSS
ncbi:MAG: LCP family protein [Parcubacteria group bacterium]|nr:LCP family protein [Parcubacteria group bacterium]